MSNELRSVHEIPPNGGLISMGLCADCGKPWSMTAREHLDWGDLVKKKNVSWPKRCKECRSIKRAKSQGTLLLEIYNTLKSMSEKAINEEYEGDSDRLAQELADLTTKIYSMMEQGRK